MALAPKIAKLYARTQITTANHAKVISLLHDKCVHFIQLSMDSSSQRRKHLNAAQNILVQFEHSLDKNNDLAGNFFLLYDYCYCQLESESRSSHRRALAIMIKIRDAFNTLLYQKQS